MFAALAYSSELNHVCKFSMLFSNLIENRMHTNNLAKLDCLSGM